MDISVILNKIHLTHLCLKKRGGGQKTQYNSAGLCLNAYFYQKISPEYTFVGHALFHRWLFTPDTGLACEENLILLSHLWEIPGVHVELYIDLVWRKGG